MENDLLIVTVYIPTPPKFKNIYERGFFMKKACHFCGNKNLKQVSIQYTYTHDNKYHYCQWGSLWTMRVLRRTIFQSGCYKSNWTGIPSNSCTWQKGKRRNSSSGRRIHWSCHAWSGKGKHLALRPPHATYVRVRYGEWNKPHPWTAACPTFLCILYPQITRIFTDYYVESRNTNAPREKQKNND